MTEQLKAEAYVYQKRPALVKHYETSGSCTRKELPINLQDWLGVLGEKVCKTTEFNFRVKYGQVHIPLFRYCDITGKPITMGNLYFTLTTGQPATEADYKAFNDIVSVWQQQ